MHRVQEGSDSVTVAEVGSTGLLALEPLVMATLNGETAFFPHCSIDQARSIVETLEEGTLPTDGSMTVVEHEPETEALPTPEEGPLGVGERAILRSCGWAMPASIADYRAASATVAADVEDYERVFSLIEETGLRGRGRGDEATDVPIADHWETARETEGNPAIVVNANDADPEAATDRLLLESAPLTVLDTALMAGRAFGATNVVVYCNQAESLVRDRVGEAAAVLEAAVDVNLPIEIVAGPDQYMAGEMTMALEALEGNHRLEARLRPPYPSEEGLYGRPTLLHTPRTLAQVAAVLNSDELGLSPDPGTRLFTVAGDVPEPATVELATDDDLTAAREAVSFDGRLKAACVGGVFGGLTRTLDVPARANALNAAGLGTNGVIELFDTDRCMVSLAGNRAVFGEEENCGRCVPCREGTQQLTGLLRDVYHGEYDAGKIRELARTMTSTSICDFGVDAPRPIRTAMDEFEPEFHAHANGRCPAGACK